MVASSRLRSLEHRAKRYRINNMPIVAIIAGINDHGLSQLTRAITPNILKRYYGDAQMHMCMYKMEDKLLKN